MPKPKLSERQIEKTICDFLEADGWICRKMEQNFSERKQKIVGEAGMPDRQCVRYEAGLVAGGKHWPHNSAMRADSQTIWLELKTKTGKAAQHQLDWHAKERARGALTLIAGRDFEASIEGFMCHYQRSGLMRRAINEKRAPRTE